MLTQAFPDVVSELYPVLSGLAEVSGKIEKSISELRSTLDENDSISPNAGHKQYVDALHRRLKAKCMVNQTLANNLAHRTEHAQPAPGIPTAEALVKAAEASLAHFQAQTESLKQVLIDQGIPGMHNVDVQLQAVPPSSHPIHRSAPAYSTPKAHSQLEKQQSEVLSPWTPRGVPSQSNSSVYSSHIHQSGDPVLTSMSFHGNGELSDMDDMLDTMTLEDLGLSSLSRHLIEGVGSGSTINHPSLSTPTLSAITPSLSSAKSEGRSGIQFQSPQMPNFGKSKFGALVSTPDTPSVPQKTDSILATYMLPRLSESEYLKLDPYWHGQITPQFVNNAVNEMNELVTDKRLMNGGTISNESDTFSLGELVQSSQMDSQKLNDVLLALLHINRIQVVMAGTTFEEQRYCFSTLN
ncbi:hypothetical protein BSLG_007372 [Batrachochytrium salamandrivorans]|nr:hypothetical protein BASA60_003936 [Batrachochytrium salamandrivorans]KAH9265088.1 hypothetical protein BASA83_011414 [Batrachochytrium salamandrivorans]KAJ1336588.1 hypothetical protein BSLG_007372 [Batrachochytrium salamandrivorans]